MSFKSFLVHVLGYGEDARNEDGDSSHKSVIERHNKIYDKFNKGRLKWEWISV